MTEYEMPMEEQIKLLVKKVDALDKKFDGIDKKFDGIDKKFDGIDKKFDGIDKRFDAIDEKFDAMDQKFTSRFDKVLVRLDQTHDIAKLALEGVQGLGESMNAKFEEAEKTSAEQTDLLKSLFVHLRKRVERVERPKRRRRP